MSRSKASHKAPGHEYWSRRPGNRQGGIPGRDTKRDTHRRERMAGKRETREQRQRHEFHGVRVEA